MRGGVPRWTPQAHLLNALGFTLFQDNRFEQAFSPLEEALALSRELHDLVNEQRALNVLGLLYTGTGDHERGLEVALQALALRDHAEVRQVPRSLSAYTTVATCLHGLGRPGEALTHIAASIEEARAQNDPLFVAVALHNLGFTYLVLESFPEAVAAFEESIPLAQNLGNRYIQADDMNGIARALHGQGRIPEAEETHRRAMAVFDDLPDTEAARYRSQLDVSPLRYPLEPERRCDGLGTTAIASPDPHP